MKELEYLLEEKLLQVVEFRNDYISNEQMALNGFSLKHMKILKIGLNGK